MVIGEKDQCAFVVFGNFSVKIRARFGDDPNEEGLTPGNEGLELVWFEKGVEQGLWPVSHFVLKMNILSFGWLIFLR